MHVFSRHGINWTDAVSLIAEALGRLPVSSAKTLDDEGVVCDEHGVAIWGL